MYKNSEKIEKCTHKIKKLDLLETLYKSFVVVFKLLDMAKF